MNRINAKNSQANLAKIRKRKNLVSLLTCEITAILIALLIDTIVLFQEFDKKATPIVFIVILSILALAALISGIYIVNKLSIREHRILNGNYNDVAMGEILLKVENLSQHFGPLKAVDNVSFEVKKGEVFGLVGESGCGKTTTGRTIIRLYDATSGDVYFKGQRICAGTLSYKNAIADAKKKAKE